MYGYFLTNYGKIKNGLYTKINFYMKIISGRKFIGGNMKPFRLLSSIFVIFVAFIFVYFIAYFFIDNSDLVYVIARVSGVNEKFAENISLLVLTVQSLIITSDWCYGKISKFLEKRVNKASKYTQ